ncbi:hypothetical protein CRD15_00915 [Corynebacterium sp. LK28]|nr:hypothetical protein [Corynebacterium sp. LK28]
MQPLDAVGLFRITSSAPSLGVAVDIHDFLAALSLGRATLLNLSALVLQDACLLGRHHAHLASFLRNICGGLRVSYIAVEAFDLVFQGGATLLRLGDLEGLLRRHTRQGHHGDHTHDENRNREYDTTGELRVAAFQGDNATSANRHLLARARTATTEATAVVAATYTSNTLSAVGTVRTIGTRAAPVAAVAASGLGQPLGKTRSRAGGRAFRAGTGGGAVVVWAASADGAWCGHVFLPKFRRSGFVSISAV